MSNSERKSKRKSKSKRRGNVKGMLSVKVGSELKKIWTLEES